MNEMLPLFPVLLPSVAFFETHKLPSQSGLYFALSVHGYPLYIGATINLRTRWSSHHHKQALRDSGCMTVAYYLCNEGDLDVLEHAMIQWFNPILNCPWRPKKPSLGREAKPVTFSFDVYRWRAFRALCIQRHISPSHEVEKFISRQLAAAQRQTKKESDNA